MKDDLDRAEHNARLGTPTTARQHAIVMAGEMGWRLGQDPDGRKVLKRNGMPPMYFATWVGAYTFILDRFRDRNATIARQRAEQARPKPVPTGTVVGYVP